MITININMDKQICAQCGKTFNVLYEVPSNPGKLICQGCVEENVKRLTREKGTRDK